MNNYIYLILKISYFYFPPNDAAHNDIKQPPIVVKLCVRKKLLDTLELEFFLSSNK